MMTLDNLNIVVTRLRGIPIITPVGQLVEVDSDGNIVSWDALTLGPQITQAEYDAEIDKYTMQHAIDAVDCAAGEARSRYITVQPGQDAVYNLKLQQATACKAAGYDATGLRLIEAESAATGKTVTEVCDVILATAAAWVDIAANIEAIRMKAIADIKLASPENRESIAEAASVQLGMI